MTEQSAGSAGSVAPAASCPQSSVAVTCDCLLLLALGHGLKQLVPRMLWRVSRRVGPPYFRAGDASLNMPPQSCTLRLKVMHGHGVANLERGEVLANLQRAIIGLTRLGDEIV